MGPSEPPCLPTPYSLLRPLFRCSCPLLPWQLALVLPAKQKWEEAPPRALWLPASLPGKRASAPLGSPGAEQEWPASKVNSLRLWFTWKQTPFTKSLLPFRPRSPTWFCLLLPRAPPLTLASLCRILGAPSWLLGLSPALSLPSLPFHLTRHLSLTRLPHLLKTVLPPSAGTEKPMYYQVYTIKR